MRRPLSTWVRWGALLAVGLATFAPPALAQKKEEELLPPYDVAGLNHSKVWVPWVFAFLFAAGIAAVAFKNPHRTHLD